MTIPSPPEMFSKREKQGFRLASFAPVFLPIALSLNSVLATDPKDSQFFKGCRYKKHSIHVFLNIYFKTT